LKENLPLVTIVIDSDRDCYFISFPTISQE